MSNKPAGDEGTVIAFHDAAQFEEWLDAHADLNVGVWLKMRPSGLAQVEAAKADGRWAAAYQSQRNATVPPDLADALAANPLAAQAFEALNKTRQYFVILKLANARTATTRAAQLRKAMVTLQDAPPT